VLPFSTIKNRSEVPQFSMSVYSFTWERDSAAMWDNLAVQHYASSDDWSDVRVMERASVARPRPTR
jgi:alpha-ketoglutarate-dependent taurine dioxygenase